MYMPIARIILRYCAGGLFYLGWLSPETVLQLGADPDIVVALSMLIGVLVEGGYALAKRWGGPT